MNCPNLRVLSDFRKDNPEFLKKGFLQSALLAKELGMVSFGHVSLEGSKFKANTSKHKAMSYDYLNLREEELVHEINELMAQAEQCDQVEDEQLQDKASFDIPEELKIKEERQEKIRAAKEALEKRENELNPGKKIEGKKQISFA
jgi:transposase